MITGMAHDDISAIPVIIFGGDLYILYCLIIYFRNVHYTAHAALQNWSA